MNILPRNKASFLVFFVKVFVLAGALWFVVSQLRDKNTSDWQLVWERLSVVEFLCIVSLSVFNWVFEVLKWQHLVGSFRSIRFMEAAEQTFASYTASVFTPARVGEYGAKVLYFEKSDRKRVLFLTFLSNGFQMGVTTFMGLLGLYYLGYYRYFTITVLGLVFFVILFVWSKNFTVKGYSLQSINNSVKGYRKGFVQKLLALSLLRYLVFSHQFFLLLYFSGVSISYMDLMSSIVVMYFVVSILPSLQIIDVVVRGGIGVYLLCKVGTNEWIVVTVTAVMWFLNVLIPVLIGTLYVLRYKKPKPQIV